MLFIAGFFCLRLLSFGFFIAPSFQRSVRKFSPTASLFLSRNVPMICSDSVVLLSICLLTLFLRPLLLSYSNSPLQANCEQKLIVFKKRKNNNDSICVQKPERIRDNIKESCPKKSGNERICNYGYAFRLTMLFCIDSMELWSFRCLHLFNILAI